MVHSGKTPAEAQERLKTTFSADKNEILFSEFGVNYNTLPAIHRKGSTLVFKEVPPLFHFGCLIGFHSKVKLFVVKGGGGDGKGGQDHYPPAKEGDRSGGGHDLRGFLD